MNLSLPREVYERPARQRRDTSVWRVVAALCCLLSGWQFFGLPGSPIRVIKVPEDLPWFGFGMQGVFIEPSGDLIIHREGYADRMKKYIYKANGALQKHRGSSVYQGEDVSGSYRGVGVLMSKSSALRLRSGPGYHKWQEALRNDVLKKAKGKTAPSDDALPDDPAVPASPRFFPDQEPDGKDYGPMNVTVKITNSQGLHDFPILTSYNYFSVFDSACVADPDLWLTSGHLKHLHHVYASDAGARVDVHELLTKDLAIPDPPDFDSALLLDPLSGRLELLLSDGRRYWFDPQSLDPLGEDKLEGYWEREYASAGNVLGRFGLRTGFGFSKSGHDRVMRALMIVFLASLLGLAWMWRTPWKYTSATTTADTSSNSKPEAT
jgi:hypothetical protein